MCTDGKPCDEAKSPLDMIQTMLHDLNVAMLAREFLKVNESAFKEKFEAAYAAHPGVSKIGEIADKAEKRLVMPRLKSLFEQFYMAGVFDTVREELDGEDLPDMDPLAGLPKGVREMLEKLKTRVKTDEVKRHAEVKPMDSINEVDAWIASIPDGHVIEEVHVFNRNGKSITVKGTSDKAALNAAVKAAMTGTE